jgi:Fic family protein
MVQKSFLIFKDLFLEKYKKRHVGLRKKALQKSDFDLDFLLTKSAFFSSKIEGNTLDLNSFINKSVTKQNKEYQEIKDLILAYENAQSLKLNQKNFLKSHAQLSKTFLAKSRRGKYRNERVGVFDAHGLVYMAVEEEYIEKEMNMFFKYIDKLLLKKMTFKESIFWASWLHLIFVLIHPFSDGNGRSGRLLEKWFLAEKNGMDMWYLETEYYYFQNRAEYYKNLNIGANYWESDFKKSIKFIDFVFRFYKK